MPYYAAAPWQALLNATPAPIDTVDNPIFDQLMGFGQTPGDDGITSFMKGLQSGMARNTPQGQQLTQEIMKSKLANQMQMQLMQEKIQLAKDNPEYKVVNTPWGANLINPLNPDDTHAIPNAPNAQQAYQAQLQANMVKNQYESSPAHLASMQAQDTTKPQLMQAQANFYNQRPGLLAAQEQANNARANYYQAGGTRGIVGLSYADAQKQAASELLGIQGTDPTFFGAQLQNALSKNPSLMAAFNTRVLQLTQPRTQQQPAAGGQQPSTTPDLSNLLNPATLGQ